MRVFQNIRKRIPEPIKRLIRYLKSGLVRLCYNERLMCLAELYLRRYYACYMLRLWRNQDAMPEWYDHRADLYRWSELRNSFWVERGVFSREVMREGCRVLDLCCGDGFFSYHFYAGIASHVDAVDNDPLAVAHANKWHSDPKVKYQRMDVVTDYFPQADYDVIVWDAAIEHFSLTQMRTVLGKCVKALGPSNGILCGYTIIACSPNKGHPEHIHEFGSIAELEQLLGEFFPFVGTVETEYPERHNVYFRAAFSSSCLRRVNRSERSGISAMLPVV